MNGTSEDSRPAKAPAFGGSGDASLFPGIMETAARSYHGCGEASSVCIFCADLCCPAAEAVSNLADEVGRVPVPVVCDSRVPGWVGPGTDAILVSYSGDCPAVLTARETLRARGCRIHAVTSGGQLLRGFSRGEDLALVPAGLGPSGAVASVLGTLCAMVSGMGVLDAMPHLRRAADSARARMDDLDRVASAAATKLSGGVVAAYSASDVSACSRRVMDAVRQSTGDLSFYGELPEFDHNELVGWSDPNAHAPELRMLVLRSGRSGGLVAIIVECMMEVLEENSRDVASAGLGDGGSLSRNVAGMILADMIAGRLARWPTYRSRSSCSASSTTWRGRWTATPPGPSTATT
ncbi:MAG: SIS domain-containing protein [Thermoplasmata archaeon]|nr:SIS domain-containing protein [Thermoplasmata archaeon]